MYKGLNIATAKATHEEQSQALHHLLDVAAPHESFTVTHFRDKALPIVRETSLLIFFNQFQPTE